LEFIQRNTIDTFVRPLQLLLKRRQMIGMRGGLRKMCSIQEGGGAPPARGVSGWLGGFTWTTRRSGNVACHAHTIRLPTEPQVCRSTGNRHIDRCCTQHWFAC